MELEILQTKAVLAELSVSNLDEDLQVPVFREILKDSLLKQESY
jgi:hypothetical protein